MIVPESSDIKSQGGFIPPIVTPMHNNKIDFDSLDALVDYLRGNVTGYLIGGSLGEHPSLTMKEREALVLAVARRRSAGQVLAVNIADNSLENCREMIRVARNAGADLLMISCPNYYFNTLPMLIAYLDEVGSYSDLPLCLYDNPLASHTLLSVGDIQALAQAVPALRAIKVTDLVPEKVRVLRESTDLLVYAGDDVVLWHMLRRGAHGAMVALPMIFPQQSREIWESVQHEDWTSAEAAYRSTVHFIHIALGAPDYVSVLKASLHYLGVIASPEVRRPLLPLAELRRVEVVQSLTDGILK